ncbi:MAG: hypothetical protein CML13_09755 [Puniceicoccaceae bacterium]|nr:hypothetical protein [Puniceicoccaceae bacterium]|tara:strand:- start:6542 stop:10348 length:3807 start_codon:yes stop_codon:yes gene_type:complete
MKEPETPSPEDFEKFQALMREMVPVPSGHLISNLRQDHQTLASWLREFKPTSAARLIASLETMPSLAENNIRIQVLQNMALLCCKGNKIAKPNDLRQWTSQMGSSPWAPQEYPSEDVFVGYVCTTEGGFRVYPGTFSNSDFILERLLNFLSEKVNFPGFKECCESVIALLRISDSIADELNQDRYITSESVAGGPIELPSDAVICAHSRAVTFSHERLSSLGINTTTLAAFVFDRSKHQDFESNPVVGAPSERFPLHKEEDSLFVAEPSCLCRAAAAFILEVVPALGGWADTFFGKENAEFFVNDVLPRLGVRALGGISLPKSPECLPPLFPYVGQFDLGKPILAFTWSSVLSTGEHLETIEDMSKEQVDALTQYIEDCCRACEKVEDFNGGLVLWGLSGVGRPVVFALKSIPTRWHFFSCGLADWQTLSFDHEFSARRLWYLGCQEDNLEQANVKIANTAGFLNLYAFWKDQDFILHRREMDPKNPHNMLMIEGSFSKGLNVELKSTNDRHCQKMPEGDGWHIVQRKAVGLNPDLSSNIFYADHDAVSSGILSGCAEWQGHVWWVTARERPKNPEVRNLYYRLWDCISNWIERILPAVFEKSAWGVERFNLELLFVAIDGWKLENVSQLTDEQTELNYQLDRSHAVARLSISEGFLGKFHRADNIAEREIVSTIIRAAADMADISLGPEEEVELVTQIVKNDKTRFFHVISSDNLESIVSDPGDADPEFIPREELGRLRVGLAFLVDDKLPKRITDPSKAQKTLDTIVRKLQEDLTAKLKQYDTLSVVSRSFSQLDDFSRDRSRWSLSTRALLALDDGADWLKERIRTESGKHATSEVANRALIETAVYSHEPNAKESISQTEHASLLAQIFLMIEIANHRDSIVSGFVQASLEINPNGIVDYQEDFQEEVFAPYITSRIDDGIQHDADSYETHFQNAEEPSKTSGERSKEVLSFEKAFEAEFGFSYDTILDVRDFFTKQAVKTKTAGGTLGIRELRYLLEEHIGLKAKQADSFVARFVLPIRPSWNAEFPKGCDGNDVLPWRYFRGLSVLLRPFVEVERSPQQFAISATHLHRWVRYLTRNIWEGNLPEKLFQSKEMSSYFGSVADKKGKAFTREVASKIQKLLPNQKTEIKLTELGAPKSPDLGDFDVLAWDHDTGKIFLIECKRLKPSLTVRQVIQKLEEFRGNMKKKDYLAKHKRRCAWIKDHPEAISKMTGIDESRINWVPLLVTSDRVPMAFIDGIDYPKSQVLAFQDLEQHIKSLVSLVN